MNFDAPWTIETTAITALTAMMMPSVVSELLNGFALSSAVAILTFSTTSEFTAVLPPVPLISLRGVRSRRRRRARDRRDGLLGLRGLALRRAHAVACLEAVERAVRTEDDPLLVAEARADLDELAVRD